jgi:HAD superfamily hydrolase (TIGR01458 family)
MSRPPVRAVLFDVEGTLAVAGKPVEGAARAIAALGERGIPWSFVTNTTSRPRRTLAAELAAMGLPSDPERIFTAPLAGRAFLLDRGWKRAHLLVRDAVIEDFSGVEPDAEAPDAVVLGDLGEQTTFEILNRAFRLLLAGAAFVTLARNRYYRGPDGLLLDQGPFVAALEYASGREAILVGKPAPEFFARALAPLGIEPGEALMVGDDLDADVGGAQRAGLQGALVRTGKFRAEELARADVSPHYVLDSVVDVVKLL